MSEAPGTSQDVVLRLEGVSKVYSGTVAVKHADFEVRSGAVNVLVGENGAGKSTLVKMIAGVERPTAGRILLDGAPVEFRSTGDAMAHGIGMVFQELNLFGNLSVAENIFSNHEIMRRGRIDQAEQERQTGALMQRLQAAVDPRANVEDLMIGQQQLVEIAKAVARNARILIMDEPTSALSAPEVEILFASLPTSSRKASPLSTSRIVSRSLFVSAISSPCCATAASPARARWGTSTFTGSSGR
jgi:erythritol transport system ATP-binding protein